MRILGLAPGDRRRACWRQRRARETSCAPGGRPIDPYYENDTFAEWPQEAQRFKNNAELVSRQRDRLRLTLDGGKSVELVDCPYGDDGYHFLYERYDQAGRFYVVRKSSHDDFSLPLVMMPTGQLVHRLRRAGLDVGEVEVPDHRLLTAAGAQRAGHPRAGRRGALATEAEFELPCDTEAARRAGTTSRGSRSPARRATAAARRARSSC